MITKGKWLMAKNDLALAEHCEVMRQSWPDYKPDSEMFEVRSEEGDFIAKCGCHNSSESNARLITAAPDLYKACKKARTLFAEGKTIVELMVVIDEALSKTEKEKMTDPNTIEVEKRICAVCGEVVKDGQEVINLPQGQVCHKGFCSEPLRECKKCGWLYDFNKFPNPDYCPDCI